MNAAHVLQLRQLAVGYRHRRVLGGIDWTVRPGEFWFLVGPNGVGKTTILRTMLGELRALSGTLDKNPEFASARQLGFVPQSCEMHPSVPTTVREFVDIGTAGMALTSGDRRQRVAVALESLRLTELAKESYWSLSGGQRQRVLVARALVRKPRLLIADEPTAGLDANATTTLLESLQELHRGGLTIIVVTHRLEWAARYGSHVALAMDGSLICGDSTEVLTPANLQSAYGVPVSLIAEIPAAAEDSATATTEDAS